MKVVILGPVVNKTSSGGVASITENLAAGFVARGDETFIISISKSSTFDNIVIGNGRNNRKKIFFSYRKISNELKKINPDLVISSLEYSIGIKNYKRKCPNSLFVSFLHGVPAPVKGRKIKAFFLKLIFRYCCRNFDHSSIASYLMQSINDKLYGIKCDYVIPNGIIVDNKESIINENERIYDLVYVGRLYHDKNVEMLCDAFLELCSINNNLRMLVCGYGEQEKLFTEGKFKNEHIDFVGKVEHKDVYKFYRKAKFFVSLCDLEGFGTVFMEAALQRCNMISTFSQGQNYVFENKPFYHLVDISNKEALKIDLMDTLNHYSPMTDEDYLFYKKFFSSKRMADDYANIVNNQVRGELDVEKSNSEGNN